MTEFIASPMFARWFLRHPPQRSLLLCSPFLRGGTLERVLEFVGFPELRPEMELKVLFRGLKRDFLQGASDLAAVELLRRMERQCGGRVEVLLSELEGCLPDSLATPEQILSEREIGTVVSRWLASQPKKNRVAFVRRYWYADSLAETARRIGCSEMAVKSLLHRMRGNLRTYLEKEGVLE